MLDDLKAAWRKLTSTDSENNDVMGEAIEALVALGYGQNEIMPILRKIKSFDKVEIVIKQVLKEMAGGNNGR